MFYVINVTKVAIYPLCDIDLSGSVRFEATLLEVAFSSETSNQAIIERLQTLVKLGIPFLKGYKVKSFSWTTPTDLAGGMCFIACYGP